MMPIRLRSVLPLALVFGSSTARAAECSDVLRMHGFLRCAQAKCAFQQAILTLGAVQEVLVA